MEPASMYLAVVCGVFGLWLAGDRLWVVGTAAVTRWSSDRCEARVVTTVVAAMLAFTLLRVGSVGAATLPVHERVILESETPATTNPQLIASRFVSAPPVAEIARSDASMYTVRPGDCLWRIARSLLTAAGASPSGVEISDYWRSIYEINRDVIGADPNLIHPGQVFQLPER